MASRAPAVAVIGGASCSPEAAATATEVGRLIARAGARLICGGRGGVMEAAAAGARQEGGFTIGILPGASAVESPPNGSIELPIFTGMGEARNLVVVLSADAVVAIDGEWGTLSEIAFARRNGKRVVLLGSWHLERPDGANDPELRTAASAEEAVRLALEAAGVPAVEDLVPEAPAP